MFENDHKITSKSKFSTQNVQIPYHLHPALSYSLQFKYFLGNTWVQVPIINIDNESQKLAGIQSVAQGRVQVVRNWHVLARELAFWSNFIGVLKRISVRNVKNTLKPWKNVVWRSKSMIFEKNVLRKNNRFQNGVLNSISRWFCMALRGEAQTT